MRGMLVEEHAPGDFCWMELATTDQAAAKEFYSGLFAWSFSEFPIGPNELYTVFQVDGREVGAASTLSRGRAEARRSGALESLRRGRECRRRSRPRSGARRESACRAIRCLRRGANGCS